MKSAVVKRSVVVNGQKTSVSLEEIFWRALQEVARRKESSVADMLGEIKASRLSNNLSSATRIFVFNAARSGITQPDESNHARMGRGDVRNEGMTPTAR